MKITIHKHQFDKLIHSRNLLIGLVIILVLIIFLFNLNNANTGKLNWGMRIVNISVSNLYPKQAQEKLEPIIQEFLEKDFFLNHKESYWQINLEKLGVEIDIQETINSGFNKKNILWQIRSLLGYKAKLVWKINQEKLEAYFQNNLSSIHEPAKNTTLVYDKEKQDFIITSSSKGIVINKNELEKELMRNINRFQEKDIQLFVIEQEPEVLETETEKAYQKAKGILENMPVKILVEDDEINIIDGNGLLELMSFEPVLEPNNPDNKILGVKFKQETIKDYFITLAPLINREPIDAQLTIKNNRVIAFALSQQGISLEIDDNIPVLTTGLLENKKQIELKVNTIQPKITTDSINNMGITALLAKGVSNFSGSPQTRIHNIKTGIAKLNGILIKKGEKFSFNNTLGEVGPEQGYKEELVIKKDKTIPEYGGGLCQVSTTLFRAAVNAGLEITQRYAHAFPVKYYNPQGFDATIYPPFPDLRFTNNTPGYILIQTKINNNDLTFELYGTNDQRKVEIDGPYQYDIEEDGSMKARLFQKVYDKKGNVIINKTFVSTYKSPDLYPIERNPLE